VTDDSSPDAERPAAPRPAGALRIGSIAGADVLVTRSWFLVAALFTVMVAPWVERVEPGLGGWKYVAGAAFTVLLYLSTLLHEASHAVAAQRMGFRVSWITLHFFGGMTQVEEEARTPGQEFWQAVVGPLASLAVGLAATAAWFVTPDGLLRLGVEGLAVANLFFGVLNLLPGLPFDGGHVLKATVWRLTGNPHRGTIVSAWAGRVIALLVLTVPFVQAGLLGGQPDLLYVFLTTTLALFLWTGAGASLQRARVLQRLPRLDARRLARRTVLVPEDMPLAQAVREAQDASAGSIVTLDRDGKPAGIVNEAALLAVPVERRPWVPTSSVARALGPGLTLRADLSGEALIRAISRSPAHEYLLVEPSGAIHGVLSTVDVDQAYRSGAD